MKKKYIKPEMKVYEIESQMLLSVSGTEEEPGVSFGDECPDDENEDIW